MNIRHRLIALMWKGLRRKHFAVAPTVCLLVFWIGLALSGRPRFSRRGPRGVW
jgi:hypothetical protein